MDRPLRVLMIALVTVLVIYVLFAFVFPWVDRQFFANPVLG